MLYLFKEGDFIHYGGEGKMTAFLVPGPHCSGHPNEDLRVPGQIQPWLEPSVSIVVSLT